ncbi:putative T7SS-secreted protein [Streptomyces sp. NPDC048248]|uniref:putative T7SS-secreted protein n=1 Tax=Streptomyces sp. NPDC048248 TaxID=3365523 RepID=UPI0037191A42
MARPPQADWETVFGFSEDPTPGDPEILEQLASEYRSISHDAESAHSVVSRLDSDELGEGKSMEALRTQLSELPKQVGKLHSSYEAAADAVAKYATRLRESQDQADRALDKGRDAKQRLDSATEVASAASAHVKSLDNAEAPPPDDEAARSSARRALADAQQADNEAAQSVEAAEAELEAARLLAVDAQELRTSDAALAKRELQDAEDEAVTAKSWWEKIGDWINLAFSVVGAILGVVAMIVTGPLGLVIGGLSVLLGVGAVVMSIVKGAQTGEWDVFGIVTGVVGVVLGGFALAIGKGISAIGKVGLGQWFRNLFWFMPTAEAASIEFDVLNGIGEVIETITHIPPQPLSKLDAVISGIGLILSVGGFIYSIVDAFGKADGGKVKTAPA